MEPSTSTFSGRIRRANEYCFHRSKLMCSDCELPRKINKTLLESLKNTSCSKKLIYLPGISTKNIPNNVLNDIMNQDSLFGSIIHNETTDTTNTNPQFKCKSLLEMAAKKVAEYYSIDKIQKKFIVIPDNVMELICFNAFPRAEQIQNYFSMFLSIDTTNEELDIINLIDIYFNPLTRYQKGCKLFLIGAVFDVRQIGFNLNGYVSDFCDKNMQFLAEINFQQCKITSISCKCSSREYWCEHLFALALHRIHKPNKMTLRVPISHSLFDFKRDQLQKIIQYLMVELNATRIVRILIDEFKNNDSILNYIGAPDSTINLNDIKSSNWFIDKWELKRIIAQWFLQLNLNEIYKFIDQIKNKMKMKDSNASKLLKILTKEYLNIRKVISSDFKYIYFQLICDEIINLWICFVVQPNMFNKRLKMREMFLSWSNHENCYLDNDENFIEINPHIEKAQLNRLSKEHRFIFDRAFRATFLRWNVNIWRNNYLDFQNSCNNYFHMNGFPIWSKHLPTASVYVASLRQNGQIEEAARMAMAIVRYIRSEQNKINQSHCNNNLEIILAKSAWIGCPFNPIEALFDALAEASLEVNSLDYYSETKIPFPFNNDKLICTFSKYNHLNILKEDRPDHPLPKYKKTETILEPDNYLKSALFIALVGLSQPRTMPETNLLWERCCIHEKNIICKLLDIPVDEIIIDTLKSHAEYLITKGILSDKILIPSPNQVIPNNIIQIPGLVRFMFGALLSSYPDLAYEIGLRSIRFVKFQNYQPNHTIFYSSNVYFNMQIELAKTMIYAAKNDAATLKNLLDKIKTFIAEPVFLSELIQTIMRFEQVSKIDDRSATIILYEIGIHLAQITKNDLNIKRPILFHYFIEYAKKFEDVQLKNLIENWTKYFTPNEALSNLFPRLLTQFENNEIDKAILTEMIKKSSLQSIIDYPNDCLLEIFSFFKENNYSFDEFLDNLEKSATLNQIEILKFQNILNFFEKKYPNKIYQITLLVAKQVKIPNNLTNNFYCFFIQACTLAKNLGKTQLNNLVNVIIQNVSSAIVLTGIIKILVPKYKLLPNHYPMNDPIMFKLIIAAKNAYMEFARFHLNDLQNVRYSIFVNYLIEAKQMIILAPDGKAQFQEFFKLIETKFKNNTSLWKIISEKLKSI